MGRYWNPARHPKVLPALLLLAGLGVTLRSVNAAGFCWPAPASCWPSRTRMSEWLSSLSNLTDVIFPDTSPDLFLSEAMSMNLLKSSFPGIIVIPGSEADLQSAVKFASRSRIRVVVRCSGHDFNGRSTGRGVMLIKMDKFKAISYDETTQAITFDSGCMHADVYGALVPYSRMYVGGQSKTVCPAGCLAGGCHGILSRQFGLAADSILEIRFMLFTGEIVTLSRTIEHAELFHAYLGAGQNSFGIALSFKAQTHPAPPTILEFNAIFFLQDPNYPEDAEDRPNVLSRFFMNTTWWESTPRELAGNINVNGDYVVIKFFYSGTDYDAANATMFPMLTSPFAASVDPVSYSSDLYEVAEKNYPPLKEIWQRKFLTNAFVPPVQELLDMLTQITIENKPYYWIWFLFGGAVPEHDTGSVPSGMRTAMYEVLFGAHWDDPHQDQMMMEGVSALVSTMYAITESSYSNEYTSWGNVFNVVPDWKTRFYKDYDALSRVKAKYDPCNFFTAQYAVGSDKTLATCNCKDMIK